MCDLYVVIGALRIIRGCSFHIRELEVYCTTSVGFVFHCYILPQFTSQRLKDKKSGSVEEPGHKFMLWRLNEILNKIPCSISSVWEFKILLMHLLHLTIFVFVVHIYWKLPPSIHFSHFHILKWYNYFPFYRAHSRAFLIA